MDGVGDVVVERLEQLVDALARVVGRGRGLGGRERRAADDRRVVAVELVLVQELADLHLDEVQELRIVDEVDLVEEDDDLRDADLAGEQDVLLRLRHRAVGGGDDEDRAVHLRGADDHVLDEVGVAGAVDVRVVALVGAVLDVRGGDREDLGGVAAAGGLGGLGDLVVGDVVGQALEGLDVRQSGGEGRLAVVDVADGADVDVRFVTDEIFLCHVEPSCILLLLFVGEVVSWVEPVIGIGPMTSSLPRTRSTD